MSQRGRRLEAAGTISSWAGSRVCSFQCCSTSGAWCCSSDCLGSSPRQESVRKFSTMQQYLKAYFENFTPQPWPWSSSAFRRGCASSRPSRSRPSAPTEKSKAVSRNHFNFYRIYKSDIFRWNLLHYFKIAGTWVRRVSGNRFRLRQRSGRLDEHDRLLWLTEWPAQIQRPSDLRRRCQRRPNRRYVSACHYDRHLRSRHGVGSQSKNITTTKWWF